MVPIIEKLRSRKSVLRRHTIQRELVLDAVERGEHPSARDIFDDVSRASGMSFGTVYRNLQILVEEGVISQIQAGSAYAHYDKKTNPHYHLHCTKCGGIYDMPLRYRTELDDDARHQSGFIIQTHTIAFEGLCARCSHEE